MHQKYQLAKLIFLVHLEPLLVAKLTTPRWSSRYHLCALELYHGKCCIVYCIPNKHHLLIM